MSYKLLIVESPTKVTSISRYLDGKEQYKVASSSGHIRDLPKKGGMQIDIENNFTPNYQIQPEKKKVVAELRKLAKNASEVIMASDQDREGEAIAWHLCHILGLDPNTTKRITFHEITKEALEKALANPRTIDQNLVNAQQARRILDRIVGFELSPVLWIKVQTGLSAGRVQSIAMRLIYEKEKEIRAFQPEVKIVGQATFELNKQCLIADLREKLTSLDSGRAFLEDLRNSEFEIIDIIKKPSFQNPSPPFKTSSLQQEAARKLGSSVKQTMSNAQKLYEAGYITYMRTDSLNLSQQALDAAKQQIVAEFGLKYHHQKQYQNQSKGVQDAHEAIRPTDFTVKNIPKLNQYENSLYQLIYKRTLASQMATAQIDKTQLIIASKDKKYSFTVEGQILRFDGFLKLLQEASKDVILPECQIGETVTLAEANILEKFSSAPSRFSEGSLVKKMEELGIGRPSTYAPTINTLLERKYIIEGNVEAKTRYRQGLILQNNLINDYQVEDKYGGSSKKLLPTSLTELVTPFLKEHFSEIMDFDFTSKIENDFDKIALGKLDWVDQLQVFYQRFHPLIEAIKDVSRSQISRMREVGIDPKDQKMIYARLGRLGPMLQKGLAEESDEKPLFAPLPNNATIETVTLEQALEMFKLPRTIGETETGEIIIAKNGPFGPYIEAGKLKVSLKEDNPVTIDLDRCRQLIKEKQEAEAKRIIADFKTIQIIDGRYGPYVTDGKRNGKVPKDVDREYLTKTTLEEAQQWLEATGKLPGKQRRYRKK